MVIVLISVFMVDLGQVVRVWNESSSNDPMNHKIGWAGEGNTQISVPFPGHENYAFYIAFAAVPSREMSCSGSYFSRTRYVIKFFKVFDRFPGFFHGLSSNVKHEYITNRG